MSDRLLESAVQRRIVDYYKKNGFIVLKIGLCNMSGYPDLQLMKDGRIWLAEVKRPGGSPTELQKARHEQLRKAGFEVRILEDIPVDGWPMQSARKTTPAPKATWEPSGAHSKKLFLYHK